MAQNRIFRGTARARVTTPIGNVEYRYHATPVVTACIDGKVLLNSGGCRTATTKVAINQALNELGRPESVSQRGGVWYVSTPTGEAVFTDGLLLPSLFN